MSQQFNSSHGRACARRLGGYFTVLAALLLTLLSPHASSQAACNIAYTISPQNSVAFGAALTINNTGTTALSSWTLSWTFANGQTVTSLWNGIETQSGAVVTVKSESYNGSIAAGGSLTGVGFNGAWNGNTNAVPTAFTLNGTACSVAGSGGQALGSFTLKPSASGLSISQSGGGSDTITVTDVSPFTGSVTLTASGMPAGVTAAFAGNPTSGSSSLSLTASSSAAIGYSTVTVTGTSGTLSASTTIALTVTAAQPTIAWVSPAGGVAGSSMTIMPGVGASFGETQGSNAIFFGSNSATVTTWAIDSVTVTVPSLPAGVVNVIAHINGLTSNAVPFTVTATTPSPEVYTGNSTWFSGLGGPYGGCGVPQANVDSQNFIALNVQNDPGNYTLELTRPISSQFAADIGLWNNGLNCGRWVHVVMGSNCNGMNDGNEDLPFCRGGLGWVPDQFNGADLDLVVADSCQDGNAWCRDDPYHIDQAQAALNNYVLSGSTVGDLYPGFWNNRQVTWNFEPAPNYTGDINIGFLNGANAYWSAISITHLANGIHGVQYLQNGTWVTATMDADLGDDYIILPTVTAGTQYEIQVFDVTNTLINRGRIYSFAFPSSCGTGCTPALTPITYTTSQ